jgi:hypothetical protein
MNFNNIIQPFFFIYKLDVDPIGSKHVAVLYKHFVVCVRALLSGCGMYFINMAVPYVETSFQQTRRIFTQDFRLHQRRCESLIM